MSQIENKYQRPSWDDMFMAIARLVATRSTCDRLRAGAVLVKDSKIIATGYNGAPPGKPHCDGEEGHLMEEGHCVRTIHAEHNAILQVGAAEAEDATLYTTYSPCIHCAHAILAVKIKRVVIGEVYRNSKTSDYLTEGGVLVNIYGKNPKWNQYLSDLFKKEIETKIAPEGDIKFKTE